MDVGKSQEELGSMNLIDVISPCATLLFYPSIFLLHKINNDYPLLHDRICDKLMRLILYLPVMALLLTFISPNYPYWRSLFFWSLGFASISYIGKSIDYIILGYSGMVFMSEFYEIPEYIEREFFRHEFLGYSDFMVIFPKLLFFIILMYQMKIMDMEYKRFMKHFSVFSIIYMISALYLNHLIGNIELFLGDDLHFYLYIFYRFLCMSILVVFIYLERNRLRG